MTQAKPSLIDDVKSAKDDLHQLVDEVKLKVHLGRKDAADAWWAALEPALSKAEHNLDDAARKLAEVADHARLQAHLGLADVKTSWPGLEKAIHQVVDDVKHAGEDLHGTFDTMRVKAHLASMEADKLQATAKTELKEITRDVESDTEKAVAELRVSFAALRKKLGV
ncbi:MAG: hypothetical protein Q8O67_00945 [Deltaproteobacteria bacterium]|nr:hypothetical protein [Deltaproteobacteria bacterium]